MTRALINAGENQALRDKLLRLEIQASCGSGKGNGNGGGNPHNN